MSEPLVCALLEGKAKTAKHAQGAARHFSACPYVYFMATKGAELYATLFLPSRQRWWIRYVEKDPKGTFGLESAHVAFASHTQYPDRPMMHLPQVRLDVAPCGADCRTCGAYKKCLGCPATHSYKGGT